jgi:ferredoxin
LYDLGDRYYAEARTPAGEALLAGSLWREPNDADRAAQAEAAGQVRRELAPTVNREALAAKLRALGESPLWEELARACVSCGTCTFLCPTCYCFDMQDEGFAGEGRRFRCWDTCQNPAFTLMTSGENPRRRRGTRVHQRIGHKFQYMVERLDRTYCVGCGRCVRLCPVGIDLREVLQEVQGAEPISA